MSWMFLLQWDSDNIYLIMEYCSGGDLSDFIRMHRTLSEYHAKRLMQQIGKYMRHSLLDNFWPVASLNLV